jgi:hypothetical protein
VETSEILVVASQVLKDTSDQLQEESPQKDAPIVGLWVQSNGWAIELLSNGDAKNTNPKGEVSAEGKWRDEGNGEYTVRFGQKSEWEWRMVLKGNSLTSEMFLNGAMFTKGTFERKGSRAGDKKSKLDLPTLRVIVRRTENIFCRASENRCRKSSTHRDLRTSSPQS